MKKNLILTLLLCVASLTRAANILSFSSVEGSPGDTVSVSMSLANADIVSSLQVALPIDANTHFVNGSTVLTHRKGADHAVSAREVNGTLTLIIVSPTMAAVQGNEGTLLTFKLVLGRKPTTLDLMPTKVIATNDRGKAVSCSAAAGGQVITRCAVADFGSRTVDFSRTAIRGNYTMPLTVTNTGNAPLTLTGYACASPDFSITDHLPLTMAAGERRQLTVSYAPMERGTVTEDMTITSNSSSRLNTIALHALPYAVNELHLLPVQGYSDSTVTVHVTMNNMDAITGLQLMIPLPQEVRYVPGSLVLSNRKDGHVASASLRGDTLTAVAVSLSGTTFTGNDGEVLSFKLRLLGPNSVTLHFSKAILTAQYKGQTQNVLSDSYGADVSILSPRLSADNSINLGRTPTTHPVEQTLTITNMGNAPLRIERATCTDSSLVLKESFPLIIEGGWNSKQLTISIADRQQKSIDAMLRLYTNDPDHRMFAVHVIGSRYVPNSVSVSSRTAFIGHRVPLHIALDNTDDLKAVQLDVVMPDKRFALATDTPYAKSARMGDMTVATNTVGDTVKVMAFSLSGATIAKGSGEIITLFFDLPVKMKEGDGEFQVARIKLSRTSTEEVHSDLTAPTAPLSWYLLGDVNHDGGVNIADASATISYVIGTRPDGFREQVADFNQDGSINVADASAEVSYTIGEQ